MKRLTIGEGTHICIWVIIKEEKGTRTCFRGVYEGKKNNNIDNCAIRMKGNIKTNANKFILRAISGVHRSIIKFRGN